MQTLLLILPFTLSASAEVAFWQQPSLLSSRAIFGRADGYSPEYNSCGGGNSCAACGDGFETCTATTELVSFCYNPTAGQKCCPNGQGRACDKGYYCAEERAGRTWCCADTLTLEECAAKYNVPQLDSVASSTQSSTQPPETVTVTIPQPVLTSSSFVVPSVTPTPSGNGSSIEPSGIVEAGQGRVRGPGVVAVMVGLGLVNLGMVWVG